MITQQVNQLVLQYIESVKKNGIPVDNAFIFGSYSRGTMNKNSDIDVCIVSPIFGHDRVQERVQLLRLREGISDLIEPHPVSSADMKSSIDPFIKEIKKSGVSI